MNSESMPELNERGISARRIPVAPPSASPSGGYDVLVGPGLLPRSGELIVRHCPAHRYAVISDAWVAELYAPAVRRALEALAKPVDVFSFPAGEGHKTRTTWAHLSDAMLAAGMGRDAAVVALGGGVTGDVAGFVAATYMRGVPVVQLPTTLLAMIDASVGGKTGVDTPAGKNLAGAFHPPALVLADPEVLRTLAPEHLRAGLAEAIKHGAIADAGYFDWIAEMAPLLLATELQALDELIVRSVKIKAEIVARDERESGPRKALNFGHTIGHAVEAASGYRLLHGEAVAIGMVVEARIGEAMGITAPGTVETLSNVLASAGLPIAVPRTIAADEVLAWTRTDKKARAGRTEYALIKRLGAVGERWGYPVEDEAVTAILDS